MKKEFVEIIINDENYQKLVKKRTSFALKLTLSMLIVYFTFILTIAFKPSILAIPLFEGSTTTIGIPLGIFIIIFAFALTGIYTFRANGEFDELAQKISKNLEEKL
ncbi:DUF485 domain-containing protein [Sulfurimonas sp. SAG-AH-194-C20]|nr:DUF485 domain-containing protein [Sulfurimonas sp. SAG-AH-194-C20]MDF1879159.1 DUF485 domain-containing protein [Sulfurimonas sp. SAG-AH-194-C20]